MPNFWRTLRPNALTFLICSIKNSKYVVVVGIMILLLEIGPKEIAEM